MGVACEPPNAQKLKAARHQSVMGRKWWKEGGHVRLGYYPLLIFFPHFPLFL